MSMVPPQHIVIPEGVHFVTTATEGRRPVFVGSEAPGILNGIIRSVCTEERSVLFAFVVMPDHLHLLLRIGEATTLARVMQKIKGRSSRHLNQSLGAGGSLWQKGYYEHGIRNELDFNEKLTYIVHNPVKAGLAAAVGEYPYCFVDLQQLG
jgi:putative transposase